MAHWLRKLKLKELSFVDRPANQHARVVLFKRAEEAEPLAVEIAKCYCCPPSDASTYQAKSFGEILASNLECDKRDKVWKEVGPAIYALECSLRTTAQDLSKSSDEKQTMMTTAVGEFLNAVRTKWPDVEVALAKTFMAADEEDDADEDDSGVMDTENDADEDDTAVQAATNRLNRKIKKFNTLLKRVFSDKERQRLADKGQAMPDGSFPIANVSDLHNAIRAIGRAKNPAAAKAHIKRRARALGASDALPESWGGGKSLIEKAEELAERLAVLKAKFDESKHPRKPKGSSGGGQFTSGGGVSTSGSRNADPKTLAQELRRWNFKPKVVRDDKGRDLFEGSVFHATSNKGVAQIQLWHGKQVSSRGDHSLTVKSNDGKTQTLHFANLAQLSSALARFGFKRR